MSKLPHNRTWYSKKLVTLAKNCAKERDNHICQKCGNECYGGNCHGSHVLPVGAYKFMELDPNNIKCMCSYDHLRWWHKDPTEAGDWFKAKFPTRWEYLDMMKRAKIKLSTVELAELYEAVRGKGWKVYGMEYAKLIERKLKERSE